MTTPSSSEAVKAQWRSRPLGIKREQPVPTADSADPFADFNHDHSHHRTGGDHDSTASAVFFAALERQGIRLHNAQKDAVCHIDGPLLCLAGAGSGKTSVLTARAAYLMTVGGVSPESLWLVTFTNKAAQEMRIRLANLPGVTRDMARRVQARTFHSFALRLLQAYAPPFQLLAEERRRHGMMKRVLRELGPHDTLQAETALAALSSLKSRRLMPTDWRTTNASELDMRRALLRFEEQKVQQGCKDFDDLLIDLLQLLEEDSNLLERLRRRFQYVLVDEFQDTTPVQYELLQRITEQHHNLAVFGDDDQTIFTFNGACHRYITEFKTQYPTAKQITLDFNFRSTPAIVGLGNAVIAHNEERLPKRMRTPVEAQNVSRAVNTPCVPSYLRPRDAEEEAQFIVDRIQSAVSAGTHSWRDFAILYRTANTSRALVECFTMNGIPFRQFGAEPFFYDHNLVRPLIDHLRLSLAPRELDALDSAVAALYIPRETGMRYLLEAERSKAKKYPLIHLQSWDKLPSFQREAVKPRIKLIKKLAAMKPYLAIREMRREFYDKFTAASSGERATAHQEGAVDTLEELESSAKRFDTVESFLKHIDELKEKYVAMHPEYAAQHRTGTGLASAHPARQAGRRSPAIMRQAEEGDVEDAVTCMTIHRAKGLEFPEVFLIGAADGILPHRTALRKGTPPDRSAALRTGANTEEAHSSSLRQTYDISMNDALLEEERRLAYVAVTRAREQLYISSPALVHGQKAEVSQLLRDAWKI